jgi:two-component system nitrate/nitrite response regulator NarL
MRNDSQDAIRVLLVDDNPIFLRVAADIVRLYPELTLVGASSTPGQTLKLAQQLQPQVILIDLSLPGLQDLDLIPRLRRLLPWASIIALSLLEIDGFYRQAALTIGADDLIRKGALMADLLPVIQRVRQARNNCPPRFGL